MAKQFRRIDIGVRGEPEIRVIRQAIRQGGDGSGLAGGGSWGSITGDITAQTDLQQHLKDNHLLHFWMQM